MRRLYMVAMQADPELEALPKPRRPWRRVTLVALVVTGLFSLALGHWVRSSVLYALQSFAIHAPAELGDLAQADTSALHTNAWVRASGELQPSDLSYHRLADADGFQLARVAGDVPVWVEVRVPRGYADFLPPSLFVGRLVQLSEVDLRHQGVREILSAAVGPATAERGWLLIDGESPAALRWVLAVVLILFGFAGFSVWALFKIARPRKL